MIYTYGFHRLHIHSGLFGQNRLATTDPISVLGNYNYNMFDAL